MEYLKVSPNTMIDIGKLSQHPCRSVVVDPHIQNVIENTSRNLCDDGLKIKLEQICTMTITIWFIWLQQLVLAKLLKQLSVPWKKQIMHFIVAKFSGKKKVKTFDLSKTIL